MGDKVSKIVQPPVLMSRLLTFVLATSFVVLGVLAFTLLKMVPLERPEVFFLLTPTQSTNVEIIPMVPDATNTQTIDAYKRGFIREYIVARNNLDSDNISITRNNWNRVVKAWSSNKVYTDFMKTRLYADYMIGAQIPSVSCYVDFVNKNEERAIIDLKNGLYNVNFTWTCVDKNSGRQTEPKSYKIQIRIQSDVDSKPSGLLNNLEKLRNNPLGIQVVQYNVMGNGTDPLNSVFGLN